MNSNYPISIMIKNHGDDYVGTVIYTRFSDHKQDEKSTMVQIFVITQSMLYN